jgi:hypothetical protein
VPAAAADVLIHVSLPPMRGASALSVPPPRLWASSAEERLSKASEVAFDLIGPGYGCHRVGCPCVIDRVVGLKRGGTWLCTSCSREQEGLAGSDSDRGLARLETLSRAATRRCVSNLLANVSSAESASIGESALPEERQGKGGSSYQVDWDKWACCSPKLRGLLNSDAVAHAQATVAAHRLQLASPLVRTRFEHSMIQHGSDPDVHQWLSTAEHALSGVLPTSDLVEVPEKEHTRTVAPSFGPWRPPSRPPSTCLVAQPEVVIAVCPRGARPGMLVMLTMENGDEIEASVPEGCLPGEEFEVVLDSEDADCSEADSSECEIEVEELQSPVALGSANSESGSVRPKQTQQSTVMSGWTIPSKR